MPTLLEDFRTNPVGSLVTMRSNPWHLNGKVCLLGDAAHAIVPFYGQGANASFEDCEALVDSLAACPKDQRAALDRYQAMRIANADAIADMAIANFVEMRDRTASRAFKLRKRVEHTLHAMFPRSYLPLYDMVSFSTIPYAQARDRARRQDRIALAAAAAAGGGILLAVLAGAYMMNG
jgi:kynurenine 3-monooxygenase